MQRRKSLRHKRQRIRLASITTGWLLPALGAVMLVSAAAMLHA